MTSAVAACGTPSVQPPDVDPEICTVVQPPPGTPEDAEAISEPLMNWILALWAYMEDRCGWPLIAIE